MWSVEGIRGSRLYKLFIPKKFHFHTLRLLNFDTPSFPENRTVRQVDEIEHRARRYIVGLGKDATKRLVNADEKEQRSPPRRLPDILRRRPSVEGEEAIWAHRPPSPYPSYSSSSSSSFLSLWRSSLARGWWWKNKRRSQKEQSARATGGTSARISQGENAWWWLRGSWASWGAGWIFIPEA